MGTILGYLFIKRCDKLSAAIHRHNDVLACCLYITYHPETDKRVACYHEGEKAMSEILKFYRGIATNHAGFNLAEMYDWSHDRLEADHEYIQWMFPSNEPSLMHHEAPVLTKEDAQTFQDSPVLRSRVLQSLDTILDFYGFRRTNESIEPVERPNPHKRIASFNHNMLRITRILKCLRLTGHEEVAQSFFKALQPWKTWLSGNCWSYWENAANEDLWEELNPDSR